MASGSITGRNTRVSVRISESWASASTVPQPLTVTSLAGTLTGMPMLRTAILALMPRSWHAALEAESRRWLTSCPNCGHGSNIWDLGGLRYKTSGNRHTGIWCPECGKLGQHLLTKT